MVQAFFNMWKIPDLRKRLLFTLGILLVYRLGFWIPLPMLDQEQLHQQAVKQQQQQQEGGHDALGTLMNFVSTFTGGDLTKSTLFGLGIMPYISAAIIFQLLGTVVPRLEELRKEGARGQQKIQEYTRYGTVALCLIQAIFYVKYAESAQLIYPEYHGTIMLWVYGAFLLTAGTVFMMWLGEQIDKHGIGNGASLIITAGILSHVPAAIVLIKSKFSMAMGNPDKIYNPVVLIFLVAAFVMVIVGSVLITQGQRRIPIQQAKHTRGRRVYGGQRSYLPLRVNHGGVMPVIFASSLLMIPTLLIGWLAKNQSLPVSWRSNFGHIAGELTQGKFPHEFLYIGLIFFFAYFWTAVQFKPREMSEQLREHGSFIPGLRPGPRTADYLERVMERITYVGAGFLAAIAVIPSVVAGVGRIDMMVANLMGGTGLLITVSVCLDFVQRVEASMMMRNYSGFLSSGTSGRGPRIRGARAGA